MYLIVRFCISKTDIITSCLTKISTELWPVTYYTPIPPMHHMFLYNPNLDCCHFKYHKMSHCIHQLKSGKAALLYSIKYTHHHMDWTKLWRRNVSVCDCMATRSDESGPTDLWERNRWSGKTQLGLLPHYWILLIDNDDVIVLPFALVFICRSLLAFLLIVWSLIRKWFHTLKSSAF